MQLTPRGADLLLQSRTKVPNNDLEEVFRGWYPPFHARAAWPSWCSRFCPKRGSERDL